MLPLPCMLVCTFVCANRTRDRGCSKHPVFPAPSDKEGGKVPNKPRTQCAARRRSHICAGWVERSDTHRPRIPALMGIASLHPSYEIRFVSASSPDQPRALPLPCKSLKFKIYAEPHPGGLTDDPIVAFLPCARHRRRAGHWTS